MMQLLLLITILPCIWASFENTTIVCPDRSECPFGQTCCVSNGTIDKFECCELPEIDRLNKKLRPGLPSIFGSHTTGNNIFSIDSCMGTVCPAEYCCEGLTNATCCRPHTCCPENYNCCGDGPSWCCAQKTRCFESYGYCKAGASMLSSAVVSLFLVCVLTTIKYLF